MEQHFDATSEVDLDKLTQRLVFEEEKRGACTAACMFVLFSSIYIAVLDMQFDTSSAFDMTQGLTYFVENIGDGPEAISSGPDIMEWVKDGLIPAVFGDVKCTRLQLRRQVLTYTAPSNNNPCTPQTTRRRWHYGSAITLPTSSAS